MGRHRQMKLPLSPRAAAAHTAAREAWEGAMASLPPYLRCGLNLHQLYGVPEIEQDIRAHTIRLKAGLPDGTRVAHQFTWQDGFLAHEFEVG